MQNLIREKLKLDFYQASKIYLPYIDSCEIEWEVKGTTRDGIMQDKFLLYDANFFLNKHRCTLLLKDVKNISDDDCVEFIAFVGMVNDGDGGYITKISPKDKIIKAVKHLMTICDYSKIPLKAAQYLQSKGYALPYINFSIEQLVDCEIYRII